MDLEYRQKSLTKDDYNDHSVLLLELYELDGIAKFSTVELIRRSVVIQAEEW